MAIGTGLRMLGLGVEGLGNARRGSRRFRRLAWVGGVCLIVAGVGAVIAASLSGFWSV
jgi:hypothetical protein